MKEEYVSCRTDLIILKITGGGVARQGEHVKGQVYTKCLVKCITKDTPFYDVCFDVNLYLEKDYELADSKGNVSTEISHYVMKHNFKVGAVFENVFVENVFLNGIKKWKVMINHYALGVKLKQ